MFTILNAIRHPLVLMILAVALWMLYPPLVNELVERLNTFYVAAVAHSLAAISMLSFTAFLLLRQDRAKIGLLVARVRTRRVLLPTLMSGFLICANHLLLYFALQTSSDFDVIAILVFETWPILFFYIDSALRRGKKSTSINDYIFSGAAFAGFLVLMIPNFDAADWLLLDSPLLITMGLAGLGGLAMAVNCFYRMKCMDAWKSISQEETLGLNGLKLGLLTETGVRMAAAPLLILAFFYAGTPAPSLSLQDGLLLLFVGFMILGVGSLVYDISVFHAQNASISALWYLMPVGAVLTLAILQGRLLNQYEAIASVLIVSSNIFLCLHYPLRSSLLILFISVCGIGIYLLFAPVFTVSHYFDLLAVSTVFFVLLASFALERTTSLNREREVLLGEFNENMIGVVERYKDIKKEIGSGFDVNIRQYTLYHIHSFLRAFNGLSELADGHQSSERIKSALLPVVRDDHESREKLLALFRVGDKLMTLESDRIPPEEMIILSLLAATNVFFSLVFRPDNLSAGIFSLIVSASMIYLLLIIYERDKYAQIRYDHGLSCRYSLDYLKRNVGQQDVSSQEQVLKSTIEAMIQERTTSLHSRNRSYWIFGVFVFLFCGFGYGLLYESINTGAQAQNTPIISSTNQEMPVIGIASPDWPSARLKAHILAEIIDEHTELTASIESPVPIEQAFISMADRNGSISIHPEVWEENNRDLIRRYVRAFGSVSLGKEHVSGKQGLCHSMSDREVKRSLGISDLMDTKVAERFDMTGNDRGDIWIGTQGWSSVEIEQKRLQAYGLEEFYEFHVFDRDVQQMLLQRNNRRGVPSLFFCYYPDALFTDSAIRLVDEPAHDEMLWQGILDNSHQVPPATGTSWPELKLRIAYRSKLASVSHELEMLLQNFTISNVELVELLKLLENGEEVGVVASRWVESNQDIVLEWLTGFDLT